MIESVLLERGRSMEDVRRITCINEIANSVTHGIGALLAVAGLVLLIVYAAMYGNAWHVVSFSIYGSTLVLMYLASTLYHSIQKPRLKSIFRVIDHAAIFLLIAGTYTPFTLVHCMEPGDGLCLVLSGVWPCLVSSTRSFLSTVIL